MPDFQKMFMASNGNPIDYKSRTLFIADYWHVEPEDTFHLTFEQVNSEWRQGVRLGYFKKRGEFSINGQQMQDPIELWHDTSPRVVKFTTYPKVPKRGSLLSVINIWENSSGIIFSGHYGSAIIREEIPNGYRYRCNDGHPDENFDDIVFRLERINSLRQIA